MLKISFILAVAAAGGFCQDGGRAGTPGQPAFSTNTQTNMIVDHLGRERFFHGSNVVPKGAPWLPERKEWTWNTSFVAKDMEIMQELGYNAIRLGTMWPGISPTRGAIDGNYINALKEIAIEARTYGIHSLLDMHQDVLSDKFCGEGAPAWAVIYNNTKFPLPAGKTPYNAPASQGFVPTVEQCHKKPNGWSDYYFATATCEAFQNLYSNNYGLADEWAKAWRAVAQVFSNSGDTILGYELFNEPWPGNIYADLLLMYPGIADLRNLQPFYNRGAAAIRTVDREHQIHFEGVTWDDFGVGFQEPPGGSKWANKSVLAYHFYSPPQISLNIFDYMKKSMRRLKIAGFMNEFAGARCTGCSSVNWQDVMDACDAHLQSWMFWEFKKFPGGKTGSTTSNFNPDGTLDEAFAKQTARTYAQIVSGRTKLNTFNRKTGEFVLQYAVASDVRSQESVIYLSEKYWYPHGFSVAATVNGVANSVTWKHVSKNTILIQHASTVKSGSVVKVSVAPK